MLNLSVVYKTPYDEKPTLMRFLGIRDFEFCGSEFIVIFCGNGEKKYLSRKYILEMTSTEANRDVTECRKITCGHLGLSLPDYKEIHVYEYDEEEKEDADHDVSINMDGDCAKCRDRYLQTLLDT